MSQTQNHAILDAEGSVFAFIAPGPAQRALARREVTRTDDPRILRLNPDIENRSVTRHPLSAEAKRRRYARR